MTSTGLNSLRSFFRYKYVVFYCLNHHDHKHLFFKNKHIKVRRVFVLTRKHFLHQSEDWVPVDPQANLRLQLLLFPGNVISKAKQTKCHRILNI